MSSQKLNINPDPHILIIEHDFLNLVLNFDSREAIMKCQSRINNVRHRAQDIVQWVVCLHVAYSDLILSILYDP